jgi:DNA ligase 1
MHIACMFAAMDSTTKRLRIGDCLTNMFRAVMALSPDDLEVVAYLTVGKLAPEYEGVDLQVGGSTVASAIMDCTGMIHG